MWPWKLANPTIVHEILDCDSFRPEIKSEIDGSTYIMRACQASEQHPALSLEVVRALLSKNKKVLKEVCSENHWTALHYCAAHNAADIAELLLSHEKTS